LCGEVFSSGALAGELTLESFEGIHVWVLVLVAVVMVGHAVGSKRVGG